MIALFSLSACGVTNDLKTVSDNGKAFMTALRDGDHNASWALLTPDVQTEIGSYDNWVAFATPRNFSKFSFSSTNVENDQAQMDGEASFPNGETYTVTLIFYKINDQWLIAGINFALK
jgi:hypothetical protein